MTITTTFATTTIDTSKGVDVFRGSKLLEHFEGEYAYEDARAYVTRQKRAGCYLRFWGVKPHEEEA